MTRNHRRRLAGPFSVLAFVACGPWRVIGDGRDGSGTAGSTSVVSSGASDGGSAGNEATADSSSGTSGSPPSSHAIAVGAGALSTCATSGLGEVRCWGRMVSGDSTFGDDEPAAVAPSLSFAEPLASLVVGLESLCAIVGDGDVTCWGRSNEGMLGYGDTQTRSAPSSEWLGLSGAVQALDLDGCACALLSGGSVQCWGPTWHGITGTATRGFCGASCFYPECCIGDNEAPASWPTVDVGAEVASLSVGTFTVSVLTPDGRVRTWGWGREGGLGLAWPEDEDLGDDETPATAPDVDVGGIAVAVAAGHPSCAVLDDGTLRCWGGPAAGYGVSEIVGDDETPASMGPVALPARVVQVDATAESTCARLEDGAVYCWGDNSVGQLGLGHTETIGDDETPLDAGPLDLGGPAVAISVGAGYACAILDDGTLRCWGDNSVGQLGYGHTQTIGDDETPASAGPVPWLP